MQFNVDITTRDSHREDAGKKTRVYVSWSGENMAQDFVNRTSRPHGRVRPLVEMVLEEAGIDVTGMTWSQKAGCSCPCSPGFILPAGPRGESIWVKITGMPSVVEGNDDERLARAAALTAL